ncbi:hypothetical protein [Halobellus sp. GM3]|uniref:hypothetical protein n=1 Tax=Halobellus sp. GM3 TaxID=3458410 RepID=UPI00403D566B
MTLSGLTTDWQDAISILFVVLLLVTVSVGPVAALQSTPDNPVFQQTTPTPAHANNSTVQHERPDSVSESGDTEAVRQWLSGRLARQLNGSAVAISQSEYQRGQDLLGPEFESRLEQYVDVAGETDTSSDDQTGEQIRETATQQQTYAETVVSYNRTYEQYLDARQSGNTTAARQYARTLENQSTQINELNQSLTDLYGELAQSGVEVGTAPESISTVSQQIARQQASIREQTFVATELQVSVTQSAVSFTEPLAITGQLTTANGTPIANQSIQLQVYERRYTAVTNATGTFTIQYRPVTLPVSANSTTISYLPNAASPYLGSNTMFPVEVQQVTPTVTATISQSTVQYGDQIAIQVNVTTNGQPVPALPITATLAGSTVNQTTSAGTTRLTRRIPPSLSVGSATLSISHAQTALAIGPVTATESIMVESTATALTVQTSTDSSQLTVRGRLTTAAGSGIPNQPVTLGLGPTVTTVTTNETGAYQWQTDATALEMNATTPTLTARFDGRGTNLASAAADTQVTLPDASTGDSAGDVWDSNILLWTGGGVLLLVTLIGAIRWIRDPSESTSNETPDGAFDAASGANKHSGVARKLLDRARDGLQASATEPEQSVITAYAALRTAMADRSGISPSLTHREFRRACESQLDDVEKADLVTVIDGYEQAVFAGTLDPNRAGEVVAAATAIIDTVHPTSKE